MEVYKDFVVFPIDYKKKFAFLCLEDVKLSWTFDVDWSFTAIKTKPKMFLESGIGVSEADGKNEPETEEAEKADGVPTIQQVAVSEPSNLLAFTTSDKSLFLYRIEGSSCVLLSRRVFLRMASIIKFSSCGKSLILADKTGDTLEYSCEDVSKPGRWIFGHISQILDLQIKSDFSCIVTTDRDEKIRVTNYPATHEIEAFCVEHKEYVSSVAFINDEKYLLSASGDKTLRLWDYKTGKQIQVIDLEFVPIKLVLTSELLAISTDSNQLAIYTYKFTAPGSMVIERNGQNTYDNEFEFIAQGNHFIVKLIREDVEDVAKKLFIEKFTSKGDFTNYEHTVDVTEALDLKLEPSFTFFKTFDTQLLFKKKFDNLKQYIDRKKARIENLGLKKSVKN